MSTLKFFGLTCLVFLLVGPLVPVPTLAISVAISTGDISKLNGMFGFSGVSYLLGGVLALEFGAAFAVCAWMVARFLPGWVPLNRTFQRTLIGGVLGAVIGCLFILPGFVSRLSRLRKHSPLEGDLASSLLVWWRSDALSSFAFFVLPSALCGALVAAWLLPKLLGNVSFQLAARKRASAEPSL